MMKANVIRAAYKNGYRTKEIVTKIATVIAYRHELPKEDYKTILTDVYYGDIDDNELYFNNSYYNNLEVYPEMENLWDKDYCLKPSHHHHSSSANRLKTMTFTYPSEDGSWNTREKPSRISISISSDGEMSMIKLSGVNPTAEQAAAMVTAAAKHSFSVYAYDRNKRKYPFKISLNEGMSGCRDIKLDLYERVGAHYRKLRYGGDSLHVSMANKVADFGMYIGDSLELLNAYADRDHYTSGKFQMYINTEGWLKELGISYSRPPKVSNLVVNNVTFDPSK